jgi:ribbon-helix-helix CopG family protein
MRNVTITLDDAIASRADAEAACRGKSVSEFVKDLIEREVGPQKTSGLEAMEKFLSGPDLAASGDKSLTDLEAVQDFLSGPGIPAIPGAPEPERLPNRQEIYDERIDELVRRYERSNLLDR